MHKSDHIYGKELFLHAVSSHTYENTGKGLIIKPIYYVLLWFIEITVSLKEGAFIIYLTSRILLILIVQFFSARSSILFFF